VGAQVHCEAVHVGFVVDELTVRWSFFLQVLLYSPATVISAVLGVILILFTISVV